MGIQTYTPTTWQDSPSTATPTDAANFNHIENGVASIFTHGVQLDTVSTVSGVGTIIIIGNTDAMPAAGTKGRLLFVLPFALP